MVYRVVVGKIDKIYFCDIYPSADPIRICLKIIIIVLLAENIPAAANRRNRLVIRVDLLFGFPFKNGKIKHTDDILIGVFQGQLDGVGPRRRITDYIFKLGIIFGKRSVFCRRNRIYNVVGRNLLSVGKPCRGIKRDGAFVAVGRNVGGKNINRLEFVVESYKPVIHKT